MIWKSWSLCATTWPATTRDAAITPSTVRAGPRARPGGKQFAPALLETFELNADVLDRRSAHHIGGEELFLPRELPSRLSAISWSSVPSVWAMSDESIEAKDGATRPSKSPALTRVPSGGTPSLGGLDDLP